MQAIRTLVQDPRFGRFITAVIIFNAAILGLETSEAAMAHSGQLILTLDKICLGIYVVELALRLAAHRAAFFRGGWNLFDLGVVGLALLPDVQGLAVLRMLRVLRVLRLLSAMPGLRRVIEGLVAALPGMGSVLLLIAIIFYMGAVMATGLFGDDFPQWFGSLGRSAFSLFQIMTLESWSMGIVRPVMQVYPLAWAFFVPFIIVTTFAVVNLVVGLIVNAMQDAHHQQDNERAEVWRNEVLSRLDSIERRLDNGGKREADR